MGFSLKKVTSAVKAAVSNPGNALKKVAVVAEGVAVGGLTTGNPLGAVAGGVGAAVKASKTGKAPALNLRTAYQTAFVGAGSALAANAAVGVAKSAVGIAKTGGLVGKAKTMISAVGQAKGGSSLLSGISGFFGKSGASDTADAIDGAVSPSVTGNSAGDFLQAGISGIGAKSKDALRGALSKYGSKAGLSVDSLESGEVPDGMATPASVSAGISSLGAGPIAIIVVVLLAVFVLFTGKKKK